MKLIPETIIENCLTVGDVMRELGGKDASSFVFLQPEGSNRLHPINTVDAYHEEELALELVRDGASLWLRNIEHTDFENEEETIVVLGSERE